MTRVGWIVLGFIALIVASFAGLMADAPPASDVRSLVSTAGPSGLNGPKVIPAAVPGLVVPVAGVRPQHLIGNWHDERGGGARRHEGLDIMAPAGTPVVAAIAGTVEKLHLSEAGGVTASVRSDDGKWIAYYAHLQRYVPGLREGQRVAKGTPIGFVGDTGNAGPGNTHLHFALNRVRPGEKWWQGRAVDPYPLLAGTPPDR